MKLLLLLLTVSIGSFLCSCESEYQRQMIQAKVLIRQEVMVRENMQNNFTGQAVGTLSGLRDEIDYHAHLSGNETVFLRELNSYKTKLVQQSAMNPVLISKFP